jgi:Fe-S cluster assembly ATPase SufC
MKELNIENLHITVGDQQIVRGLTLRVPRGEVQALNSRRLDLRTASSSV